MQYISTILRPTTQDLTGEKFERLIVIGFRGYTTAGHAVWICDCACGNVVPCLADNLRSGNSKSCGCWKEDFPGHLTHGKSATPEYRIWNAMIQRCTNPKQKSYADYGARGIHVCERWAHSFEAFYADMGPRPTKHHTIERRVNTGHYEPDNCTWETRQTQNRNKSNNYMLTHNGITQCAAAWEVDTGIKRQTILYRKHNGWSDTDALTMPVGQFGHRRHRQIPK